MNSVRASNVSRRPRRVSRPRPVQPERNHQERGNASRISLSVTERLVKQLTLGMNCFNRMTRRIYVSLVVICSTFITGRLAVVVKKWAAIRSLRAAQRSQETPRLMCLWLACRPRFVLLDFCPESAFRLRV